MRTLFLTILLTALSITAFGQTPDPNDILKPDPAAVAEAERIGANAVKLLPRGMFEYPGTDADNPLGVRGGGAYYSFTTRSHSYNKIPQIELQQGMLSVGFYGASYGMIAQLGDIKTEDADGSIPELDFLVKYIPSDIESEARAAFRTIADPATNKTFHRSVKAVPGNTYVLRAISYNEADTLVAFTVHSIEDDGSVNLIWRTIADFKKPVLAYFTDEEMREKLTDILKRQDYRTVQFTVTDNEVTLTGTLLRNSYDSLMIAIGELRPSGIVNNLTLN